MTATVIAFGDAKAVKRWSTNTWVDIRKKSYFESRFIGTDDNSIIQRKTELESAAGDDISFDLCIQMRQKPTYGDNRLDGKQENLKFFSDELKIDQVRHAASCGGAMTQKRTEINLRTTAKSRLSEYFARLYDEYFFMYLSGARGINQDFIEDTAFTGFANNTLSAPDTGHLMYGGAATSKATIASTDYMTKAVIERVNTKADMMQALDPSIANMVPVSIGEGGGDAYVCVMSPFQEYSLRTSDTTGWIDIQKAAITHEGKANPIFKGGLGMIGGTILHKHRNTIRFSDYGAGANLSAARALFMGRQAGVIGFGTTGGMRMSWKEETKDFGNEPTVASGMIIGIKKASFNSKDFGVIAIDTYAANPNS